MPKTWQVKSQSGHTIKFNSEVHELIEDVNWIRFRDDKQGVTISYPRESITQIVTRDDDAN